MRSDVNIAEDLTDLYSDYYQDEPNPKRTIAAKDSVDHIVSLYPRSLGSVVDVGAGNGSVIDEISRRNLATEISALEISESGIERIESRQIKPLKEVRQFDGYHIPYDDMSFDSAICNHVLEHVEHERIFLRELGRIAKDIFVEVPLEGGARGKINYAYGHINYYTPLSFRAILETSGLELVSAKVFTPSVKYERFCHGYWPGTVRAIARSGLLRITGNRATDLMSFVMMAHCRRKVG